MVSLLSRHDKPAPGKLRGVLGPDRAFVEEGGATLAFFLFQETVVNPGLARRGIDCLTGGQADLLIDLFQRQAGGKFFCPLKIEENVVLIDKLFHHAPGGAEVSPAAAEEKG